MTRHAHHHGSDQGNDRSGTPHLTIAVGLAALLSAFVFAQHDDTRARAAAHGSEAAATATALQRFQHRVCNAHETAVWAHDHVAQCLREAPAPGDHGTGTAAERQGRALP